MKSMNRKRMILCMALLPFLFILSACGHNPDGGAVEMPSARETEAAQTGPSVDFPEETDTAEPEAGISDAGLSESTMPEAGPDHPSDPVFAVIDQNGLDAFFADTDAEATPFSLSLVSESGNSISDPVDWFSQNQLYLPMVNGPLSESARQISENPALDYGFWEQRSTNTVFFDDIYVYEWSPEEIRIYDFDSAELLYQVQISSDQWYLMGNCACVRDGVLYACSVFNGYAMPGTCYLTAYDLANGKVLWRSEDQTCNSMNFILKDDVIFCGYGFTAEPDYIYQISARTGKVLSRTPVLKMPDLFAEKDGKLYVHTYSYDYIFQIEG